MYVCTCSVGGTIKETQPECIRESFRLHTSFSPSSSLPTHSIRLSTRCCSPQTHTQHNTNVSILKIMTCTLKTCVLYIILYIWYMMHTYVYWPFIQIFLKISLPPSLSSSFLPSLFPSYLPPPSFPPFLPPSLPLQMSLSAYQLTPESFWLSTWMAAANTRWSTSNETVSWRGRPLCSSRLSQNVSVELSVRLGREREKKREGGREGGGERESIIRTYMYMYSSNNYNYVYTCLPWHHLMKPSVFPETEYSPSQIPQPTAQISIWIYVHIYFEATINWF